MEVLCKQEVQWTCLEPSLSPRGEVAESGLLKERLLCRLWWRPPVGFAGGEAAAPSALSRVTVAVPSGKRSFSSTH